MNATLTKFGYPESLIAEYPRWCVLLRPAQVTLGALVLGAKSGATAFSALESAAFAELADVIADIEGGLRRFRSYDRINYLMLMMVDPNVHFHVIPRYGAVQAFRGTSFADAGWPGPPTLGAAVTVEGEFLRVLRDDIKRHWTGTLC